MSNQSLLVDRLNIMAEFSEQSCKPEGEILVQLYFHRMCGTSGTGKSSSAEAAANAMNGGLNVFASQAGEILENVFYGISVGQASEHGAESDAGSFEHRFSPADSLLPDDPLFVSFQIASPPPGTRHTGLRKSAQTRFRAAGLQSTFADDGHRVMGALIPLLSMCTGGTLHRRDHGVTAYAGLFALSAPR